MKKKKKRKKQLKYNFAFHRDYYSFTMSNFFLLVSHSAFSPLFTSKRIGFVLIFFLLLFRSFHPIQIGIGVFTFKTKCNSLVFFIRPSIGIESKRFSRVLSCLIPLTNSNWKKENEKVISKFALQTKQK